MNNITKLSVACRGPLYTHKFPAEATTADVTPKLPDSSQRSQVKETTDSSKSVKQKKLKRRISSNLFSNNTWVENLRSPWDANALELKMNQSLPWPVGSFSLAFWLYVDSGKQHVERDHHARTTRGKSSRGYEKHHGKDMKDDVDIIAHVMSFGTRRAWFEVWVNLSRATLICR